MTENEAIEMFKERLGLDVIEDVPEYAEALRTAVSALKEIQQYRKIGTVEECREARGKQRPKKPETTEWDFDYYKCPVCGEYIWATDNINSHKYCLNCGQKIKMEESE